MASAADLALLNEIARIATLDLDLRPMLQRITETLARSFDWQFVALVTVEHDRGVFVCEAVTSTVPTDVTPGYSRVLGSGVVGEVAATGKPLLLDDVRLAENYIETLPGALSELCIPLRHGSRVVAILNLESTRLAAFHDQLPLLITVADQIAPAIANARLYDELKQRARLMEMMSEVSRTALAVTDLDELLHRVVAYIRNSVAVEVAAILLHDAEKGEYRLEACAGAPATIGQSWPITAGVNGRCIRTKSTQFVADIGTDPDYLPVTSTSRAELAVPILHHGAVLGVLNLESAAAEFFTPANVVAFEAFADQIAGAIHLAAVTRDLEEANRRLHKLSFIDALTGVANRRRFDEAVEFEWRRSIRAQSPVSLLMIDIDAFKLFNDAHGHQTGDECLAHVATLLSDSLHRAGDLVARYGGEEFAVLLAGTDREHARRVAERLRVKVADESRVTISIGAACAIPSLSAAPAELIAAADRALYEAKRGGRNRVVVSR